MAEETKLYDNENSSDDEITFKFDDNKYKSKPIDLLSADASTTPMDNANASIAESIKSLLQEFQNNNANATLVDNYKPTDPISVKGIAKRINSNRKGNCKMTCDE